MKNLEITKEVIHSVHDYFRDKLVSGNFKVVSINDHTIIVKIDDEFTFSIWHANKDYGIETYANEANQMLINFRVKDKAKLWSKIKKILGDKIDKKREAEEKRQYEILKAKFENN